MNTLKIEFEDIEDNTKDTISIEILSNKSVIKKRVKDTQLLLSNSSFEIIKWSTEDDGIPVNWKIADSVLGRILVASTAKGICFVGFITGDQETALKDMKARFPGSSFLEKDDILQKEALDKINDPARETLLRLHLRGSEFQLGTWKRILLIPFGGLCTYLEVGQSAINARATGSAVGSNPVSVLIPCHRVVRSDGNTNGYHWGDEIKRKLLKYEFTNAKKN